MRAAVLVVAATASADDAPWKREMYASLETYLREKSERAVLEVSAAGGS